MLKAPRSLSAKGGPAGSAQVSSPASEAPGHLCQLDGHQPLLLWPHHEQVIYTQSNLSPPPSPPPHLPPTLLPPAHFPLSPPPREPSLLQCEPFWGCFPEHPTWSPDRGARLHIGHVYYGQVWWQQKYQFKCCFVCVVISRPRLSQGLLHKPQFVTPGVADFNQLGWGGC